MTPRLSTTSFAVLGLLALRPATAYEIAQQMQRSLDYCWPTPERSLYDQPARLVAAGLAEVIEEGDDDGPRRYRITADGRAALRTWLAEPTAVPRFQNEPLLRVLFADQAGTEELANVLAGLRAHVADRRRIGLETLAPYLDGNGLFQDRAHIVTIVGDLISRLLAALDDWAADTAALTASWETTTEVGLTDDVRALVERIVARERAALAREVG